MDSIQKVMQYFADQRKYPEVQRGYFGTLIENFECDKTFFTSVEVTAGGRLVSATICLNMVHCFFYKWNPC